LGVQNLKKTTTSEYFLKFSARLAKKFQLNNLILNKYFINTNRIKEKEKLILLRHFIAIAILSKPLL
jgi:hypothetical protein